MYLLAKMHSIRDGRTDGRTDGRYYDANRLLPIIQPYCVQYDRHTMIAMGTQNCE